MSKFNASTSLNQEEFNTLLSIFQILIDDKLTYFTLKGDRRKIPQYRESKNSSLFGAEKKLRFILQYFKENPTQSFFGCVYNITQSKVSEWIHFLTPVLEKSLKEMSFIPKTGFSYEHTKDDSVLCVDVTENKVPRQTNYMNQKEEYSGKKKFHTMKYLAICNDKREISFLSCGYFGSKHDKSILDLITLKIENVNVFYDLGFQGVQKQYKNAILPYKKRKIKS